MNANSGRRKHQVKVRSVVGVHEALLPILEDSNTISLYGNSLSGDILTSTMLERDEKYAFQNRKRYTFDACFPVREFETEIDDRKQCLSLKVNIDSCVSLLLAGFNSTLLLSDMFATQSSSSEAFSDIGVAERIVETMFKYNSFSVPPNFEANKVDAMTKLQICCYEVFDSAIFDLMPSSFVNNMKNSTTKKPRVNQHMNALDGSTLVDVDGVAAVDIIIQPGVNPDSLVSLIRTAISERLVLVKSNLTQSTGTTTAVSGLSIIGAVGNLFLTLKVEQVWQKSNLSSSDGRETSYRRQASLTLVSLASAATYKSMQAPSSKPKDLSSSPFDDSVSTFSLSKYCDVDSVPSKASSNKLEEDGTTQEKLQKQLNGALKALSSLSRIVQIRRNMESNDLTESNSSSSAPGSGANSRKTGVRKNLPVASQHIPYRDSILTRLLQSSLEGNCFLFVLLYIKPKTTTGAVSASSSIDSLIDENTYRMVQFASEISSIHNTIWANDAIIPQYGTTAKSEDISKVGASNDGYIPPLEMESPPSKDLHSNPVEKGQGYELIQNALKLLSEDLRLWDIEQLDCIKNLGKEIVPTKVVKIYKNNERYSNVAVSKESEMDNNGGRDNDYEDVSGYDDIGYDIHNASLSRVGSGEWYASQQTDSDGRGAMGASEKSELQDRVVSVGGGTKVPPGATRVNISGRAISSSSSKTSGSVANSPGSGNRRGVQSRSSIGASSANSKFGSMKRASIADSLNSSDVQSASVNSKYDSSSFTDSYGHVNLSGMEDINSPSYTDVNEGSSSASAVAMKILKGVTPSTRRVQVLPPLVKTSKSIGSNSAKLTQPSRSKQSKNQSSGKNSGIQIDTSPGSSGISTAISPQGGGATLLPSIDATALLSPRRSPKLSPRSTGLDFNHASTTRAIVVSARGTSLSDEVDSDPLQQEEPEDDMEQAAKEGRSVRSKGESSIEDSEDHLTEEEKHFLHCVARGFLDLVEDCIMAGVDITVKNRFHRDALQIATRNGYMPILKRLFKAHGGRMGGGLQQIMSTRSVENGDSLVHIAARYGHLEILRWFKDIGFPFNVVNHKGRTPVHSAAERAQLAIIQYLHNVHGNNLNFAAEDEDGLNPLDCIPLRADMVEPLTIQHCREFISDIYVYG